MVEPRDLAPGRAMVDCFAPFLRHLLSAGLTGKTLRRHRDNLWLLGGELIRRLHEEPRLRRRGVIDVVIAAIHHDEGPLIRGGSSEHEQRAFDATCRKLHHFLIATKPRPAERSGCGHAASLGQRKRVVHMPTAAAAKSSLPD